MTNKRLLQCLFERNGTETEQIKRITFRTDQPVREIHPLCEIQLSLYVLHFPISIMLSNNKLKSMNAVNKTDVVISQNCMSMDMCALFAAYNNFIGNNLSEKKNDNKNQYMSSPSQPFLILPHFLKSLRIIKNLQFVNFTHSLRSHFYTACNFSLHSLEVS